MKREIKEERDSVSMQIMNERVENEVMQAAIQEYTL